jgi:hypothetical protein
MMQAFDYPLCKKKIVSYKSSFLEGALLFVVIGI